ncbi:ParB/Srx family N-terminal domain-containing protein [Paenirhodobacter populi]|uniref:ParB/Sulfiredoxin domain-containing protein n=1 Tax=Paenirhodobacter populi TaxID=2306993 RepID=A0A443IJH6_9RHOB|nr:ParB/Srx family N-terminal domain-containing protein [Sinirhodobacter populi]RWR04479.1 hypothetical protein D2T33_20990 [Sinirhodobacter populi]
MSGLQRKPEVAPGKCRRLAAQEIDVLGSGPFLMRPLDELHVKELADTIRRTGKALDRIIVWRLGSASEWLVVDGMHSVAAYRAARWTGTIPVQEIEGAYREVLLWSFQRRGKASLPMTPQDRANAAWKLVRDPFVKPAFSKAELALVSGVSARTIATMRSVWKYWQKAGATPTGFWAADRRGPNAGEREDPLEGLTDEEITERQRAFTGELKDFLDPRKHSGDVVRALRDLLIPALAEALGTRTIRELRAYVGGVREEDEEPEEGEGETPGAAERARETAVRAVEADVETAKLAIQWPAEWRIAPEEEDANPDF